MEAVSKAIKTAYPNARITSGVGKKSGCFDVKITNSKGVSAFAYNKYGGDGQICQDKIQPMLEKIKTLI